MSLVPDYDDSLSSSASEDEEDDSDRDFDCKTNEQTTPKEKLPAPDFIGSTQSDPEILKTSVFKNPFTEAENAKEAILQKHVKMVDTKDNMIVINGKKICWNYRKGRCRFGHNCKFAHDSDIQKSKDEQFDYNRKQNCQSHELPKPSAQELEQIQRESIKPNQQQQQKRKKRPGLTQGLVPGKKVMKNYANQKF